MGLLWTGSLNLTVDLDEKVISMVTDYDTEGGNKQLTVHIKVDRLDSCELFFYAPYWIVNKTGLPLQIRVRIISVVQHSQTRTVFGNNIVRRAVCQMLCMIAKVKIHFSSRTNGKQDKLYVYALTNPVGQLNSIWTR